MSFLSDAHDLADKKLEQMEKRLTEQYYRAEKDLTEKWQSYMDEAGAKVSKLEKEYADAKTAGNKEEARRIGRKLSSEKRQRTINDKKFKSMTDDLAKRISTVNQQAAKYINGETMQIYSGNYIAVGKEADRIVKGYAYDLVNEDTLRELSTETKSFLPPKRIDVTGIKHEVRVAEDIRWNVRKMNNEVLQGILQGESMDDIAKRFRKVMSMNYESSIRNARTCVTAAENKGRQDGYHRAAEAGIVFKKKWIATDDGRVRPEHAQAGADYDDKHGIDEDEPFIVGGEEMMHPGDNSASGWNIYNCRCTTGVIPVGFRNKKGEIIYIED